MTYRTGRAVALLVLLCLAALPSFAGEGVWTPVGPPGSGPVSELVLDPSNPRNLYAISFGQEQSGVWKSVDSGESWTSLNAGLGNAILRSLVVDPLDPDRLYVLGQDHSGQQVLYTIEDGDSAWREVHRRNHSDEDLFEQIVVDRFTPGVLYARYSTTIWRSLDSGRTWNVVGSAGDPGGAVHLMADPAHQGTLYASAGPALWKSAGAGAAWTPLHSFDIFDQFELLALGASDPATVYGSVRDVATAGSVELCVRLEDDGQTLTPIELSQPEESCIDLAVDPADPETLYVLSDDEKLYVSTNGGDSWVFIQDGIPETGIRRPLQVDFENAILYLLGNEGILRSTDGGATWEEADRGFTTVTLTALLSTPGRTPALYTVSQDGNLMRTRDGGRTWTHLGLGPVSALAADPAREGHLFAVTIEAPRQPRLFETFDQGATWVSLGSVPTFDRITRLAVNPTNSRVLYAGTTSSGIFKSTNGGRRWRRMSRGLTLPCKSCQAPVTALEIHPRDARIVHAVHGWRIFRSQNGGKTWTQSSRGLEDAGDVYALILDRTRPNILYAGTRTGVFKSTDGGATWRESGSGLPEHEDFGVLDLALDTRRGGKILYAATRTHGVYRSTDQGANWEPINEGLPILAVDHVEIDYRHAGGVFAGTFGAGVWGRFE